MTLRSLRDRFSSSLHPLSYGLIQLFNGCAGMSCF